MRIYLGAAPGVGKTFAMLNEAHRRRSRGTDVVVGIVETHGRANTQAQIGDLEIVPRRVLEYRGRPFEEMDVDAVLRRRPEVALVDELAHSNVEGSRHEKRWQDVEELLEAGIEVIATVNVQHLESLSDVVERITGVRQRETIPDSIVRRAEQLELVDMAPEALRRRMAHGNIYRPDRIDAALGNYFRPGNLAALRELALLWVADQVDESLEAYRQRHGIVEPWETRERVLVALTGAAGAEAVIRRAARMAQRSRGELLAVHVRSDDGLSGPPAERLDVHRRLLADLGGEYHELVGSDVGGAIVGFARAENCTQIVLGASRRSRWTEVVKGSIVNRIVAASGSVDVHVISYESPEEDPPRATPPLGRRQPSISRRRQAAGWALAGLGLPLLTLGLVLVRDSLELSSVLLLYLLLVVSVAALGGRLLAVAAAVAGFALANWFFTPPLHGFTIADTENLLALAVFVVVASTVSGFVSAAARQAADARRARNEADALARVAATFTQADPLGALVAHLRSTFALDAVAVLRARPDGQGFDVEVSAGQPVPGRPEEASVTEPLGPGLSLAVVGRGLAAEDRQVLKTLSAHLAAALERDRLAAAAAEAGALSQANDLRAALLQAVSHDLRTPLASIKASVSSLRQDDVTWPEEDVEEFLATIEEETDRLTVLVANLLDVSRLQAGVVRPGRRPVGLEEVVPAALASLGGRAAGVDADLSENLPRVAADPALLERVVANLVANALDWSPPGGTVRLRASCTEGQVQLLVADQGPGIPAAERERVLRPFERRGDGGSRTGVGLGLAVVSGFTRAMGGELALEDTPGGGLTVVVSLPMAEAAATEVPAARVPAGEGAS